MSDFNGDLSPEIIKRPNRLINEKSPYLLQHAYNPVNWYPWGDEAFANATAEDKPIFLSIGYSTCHWCHVMAHESFEDIDVARVINEVFVAIKVDREERPDVDGVYMAACQSLIGSGGWPLTIIMTSDKEPFFAGTYFAKNSQGGRIGLVELAARVQDLWTHHRDEVLASAGNVTNLLQQPTLSLTDPSEMAEPALGEETLQATYDELVTEFDGKHGGFGMQPKFPLPHNLLFLLRFWRRFRDSFALQMVERTLQSMHTGGIYDQVGFGFHRYTTDPAWRVPHFEKMLYDQALLAIAYLEAYQATQNESYSQIAREIFTYVLRDLIAPEGAFYAAEDADSEGEEGKFYKLTYDEIAELLPPDQLKIVAKAWDIQKAGNYREEATGLSTGKNVPHFALSFSALARSLKISEERVHTELETARQALLDARGQRVRPGRDEKILADWNGLMVAALARGTIILGDQNYAETAARTIKFMLANLRDASGRLLHRYREGQADFLAFLDDYAFLTWGLLELFEATFDVWFLQAAADLTQEQLLHFWDDSLGAFYFTPDDGEQLLARQANIYDGAIPSGNSVSALNLIRLARLLNESDLEDKAVQIGQTFAAQVRIHPSAYTQLLLAIDYLAGPAFEVIIAGDPTAEDTQAMLRVIRKQFVPNKVVVVRPATDPSPAIDQFTPFYQYQIAIGGQATAYVCQNHTCQAPCTSIEHLLSQLQSGIPGVNNTNP